MGTFHTKLLQSFHNFRDKYLKANGKFFIFSYDSTSGQYGYTIDGVFHPFKTAHTQTKIINTTGTTDMGENHEYRYLETSGLMNIPSATKSITANGNNIDVLNYDKVNVNISGTTTINCGSGNTLQTATYNIAAYTTTYRSLVLGSNLFVNMTGGYTSQGGQDGAGSVSYDANTGILTIGRMTFYSSGNQITLYFNYTIYATV